MLKEGRRHDCTTSTIWYIIKLKCSFNNLFRRISCKITKNRLKYTICRPLDYVLTHERISQFEHVSQKSSNQIFDAFVLCTKCCFLPIFNVPKAKWKNQKA